MKRTIRAITLVVGLAASFGVYADFITGNKLKQFADADERLTQGRTQKGDSYESGLFLGYVSGVLDAYSGIAICTTSGFTIGQASAMVTQYLNANPAKWNEPASELVLQALGKRFPCKAEVGFLPPTPAPLPRRGRVGIGP